jgi:hypothetical protein
MSKQLFYAYLRGIEEELLQQYRNDPKRYKALLERVQHKADTRQKAHQELKEELVW